jgi:hypothetical protein
MLAFKPSCTHLRSGDPIRWNTFLIKTCTWYDDCKISKWIPKEEEKKCDETWSKLMYNWSDLQGSFLELHNCVAPFTSHGKLHKFGAEKPISKYTSTFWLFHNKFYCLESHTEHRWRCSKCQISHTITCSTSCALYIMLYSCWDCRCAKYI